MARLTRLPKVVIAALEDLKGLEIKVMDVKKQTAVTDWMIICTGTSNRHVKSMAENVVREAKKEGVMPRGMQGMEQGEWVLVDLVEVVVHVMLVGARAHYQLEKLWDFQPDEIPTLSKPKAKPKTKAKAKPKAKTAGKSKAKPKAKPAMKRGSKLSVRKPIAKKKTGRK